MANYLKIEWYNDSDLGDILYKDGYKNRIFLDVEVEKPEYNTTIESDLNGDNVEVTKFRKWEKVYRFEMWGQEDLVDAFTLMQIHDNIEVTLQSGDVIQVAKHGLRAEVAWEEIGCLAKISVSFAENYTVAGNCDENMNQECLCATSGGDFDGIYLYSALPGLNPLKKYLIYTVADIAGKKYTASIYEFRSALNAWVEVPQLQYTCWENTYPAPDETWIFDGQFWHLTPGYIISLVKTGGFHVTVTAWIMPGAFGTIFYDGGIGWVDLGDYTADDLIAGVDIETVGAGSLPVKIHVLNHSCDYGEVVHEHVTMP